MTGMHGKPCLLDRNLPRHAVVTLFQLATCHDTYTNRSLIAQAHSKRTSPTSYCTAHSPDNACRFSRLLLTSWPPSMHLHQAQLTASSLDWACPVSLSLKLHRGPGMTHVMLT